MSERKVGNMGQGDFIKLCADAGLSCGTSQGDDSAGWDFFVDFPLNQNKKNFLSEDDRSIECKIQVKSSDNKKRSIQVKLSNMKRFCDSTLPCFFFIAEYNGGITPENIYLVHTGKELISRILKRLRENVAKNNTSINHITMNISYGKEDKITSFSGQALKEKIESHIKDGMNSYIKIKEKLLNELGYDKAPYEMKFQLDSPSDYTALVMSYLGYPKEIKISNVSSLENRFNIKLKNDELSQQKAMIELSNIKPTESGEIVLKSNGELLNFSCEYFLSPFIKSQKESDPILRVKCENFDMLISQGKSSNTKINFMHPKKISNIFEVRDVILLQNMLFNNDGKIFIELHRENSLPMKFSINGQKSNGELDIKELQLLMLSINNLVQLAGKARIEKKLNLSISSLEKNIKKISNLSSLINQETLIQKPVFRFEIEELYEPVELTGKISSLFQIILSFEEINVSFIFSVTGGIEDVNGKHIIKNHKIVSENIIYRSKLTELEKEAKEYSESFSNENPYKCSYILNTLTNKIIGF